MVDKSFNCDCCNCELAEAVFVVWWGNFCGAECATKYRHQMLDEESA